MVSIEPEHPLFKIRARTAKMSPEACKKGFKSQNQNNCMEKQVMGILKWIGFSEYEYKYFYLDYRFYEYFKI